MISIIKDTKILTKEDILKTAPAVYAKQPKEAMSERYVFVPTDKILNNFAEAGWYPTKAFQSKSKKDNPAERKHIIRLSNPDIKPVMPTVGSLTPEILLINSHNGTSTVHMEIGIYRLVCANGLIISDSRFAQIKRRHSGTDKEEIFRIVAEASKEFPDVWSKVDEYRSLHLTTNQRFDFAVKAVEFNWSENSVVMPKDVLHTRRSEDESDDLFTTMNILQENLIKGGIEYQNPRTMRARHTRSIKNADRDIRVNTFLWSLMENFRTTGKFVI